MPLLAADIIVVFHIVSLTWEASMMDMSDDTENLGAPPADNVLNRSELPLKIAETSDIFLFYCDIENLDMVNRNIGKYKRGMISII